MQIKFILSALAALAVANPVPAENAMTPRDIDHVEISNIRQQSYTFASAHVNIIPNAYQISQAKAWWPAYITSFPDSNPVFWPADIWSWYYCYATYPQYITVYWNYWNPLCPGGNDFDDDDDGNGNDDNDDDNDDDGLEEKGNDYDYD
ncbi:hypothetical protein AC578_10715 [Pseudocercospora eumusae]|uniref:Uncharacterized protein n=1 Tax=Pseudocercospora eumusae TaxID=321146 RepID=A0A139H4K1_9PEZI|nr:hypothetical protein AC578_10715 [Pseudocercospora eumusae]